MAVVIRAHFDGKTIVPDEPVDLPINEPLKIELRRADDEFKWDPEKAREAIRQIAARAKPVGIPAEALRRESMYDPDRGL